MLKLKKTIAFILSFAIIISVFTLPANAENNLTVSKPVFAKTFLSEAPVKSDVIYNKHKASFTNKEQSLCSVVKSGIGTFTEKISIKGLAFLPSEEDRVSEIIQLIIDDNPEFYTVYSWYYQLSSTKIYYIYFQYCYSEADAKAQMGKCEQEGNKLIADLKDNNNLTDLEKALLVHDRLINEIEYCQNAVSFEEDEVVYNQIYRNAFNLYGALGEKIAVCQGYSEAYMFLLRKIGIECYYVSSTSINHAWNILNIDGKFYYADLTWDDSNPEIYGEVNHNYFLLSYTTFKSCHKNANDFFTICDAVADSKAFEDYFWKNCKSEFNLSNNVLYFINNTNNTIYSYKDGATEKQGKIEGNWINAKLSSYNNELYYSGKKNIYKFNTESRTSTVYYTPEMPQNYNIYGFSVNNGLMYILPYLHSSISPEIRAEVLMLKCVSLTHKDETRYIKATISTNGTKCKICSVCGEMLSRSNILKISKISLSKNRYVYNCKNRRPTVYVKKSNGEKLNSAYYTVSFPKLSKKVGKYKIKVTLKGNLYSGSKTLYFKILPKSTKITSTEAYKNKLKIKVKKISGASGYNVQYSKNKSFKSKKSKTVNKTLATISKLKSKKRYYIRVRTYKKIDGVKYYSAWSKVKYKRTK